MCYLGDEGAGDQTNFEKNYSSANPIEKNKLCANIDSNTDPL